MSCAGVAALIAGSLGGAVGVFVSFPLDTLKTKAQTAEGEHRGLAWATARRIFAQEGVSGFYVGVQGMMLGQAFIKASAFSVNDLLDALDGAHERRRDKSHENLDQGLGFGVWGLGFGVWGLGFGVWGLGIAECQLQKQVMRQAAGRGVYSNDLACAKAVVATDGVLGLFLRGLGATMIREGPSYGVYFVCYANLRTLPSFEALGPWAALLAGALSGILSWVLVYPSDVVKT
ncbi:mitochondrial carrier domain-containing protein, partial [Baffinella frigidus]